MAISRTIPGTTGIWITHNKETDHRVAVLNSITQLIQLVLLIVIPAHRDGACVLLVNNVEAATSYAFVPNVSLCRGICAYAALAMTPIRKPSQIGCPSPA